MRILAVAFLYTGLALGANAVQAGEVGVDLLVGDMARLVLEEPRPLPEAQVYDAAGAGVGLAAYRGKWLVVNFWATWCVPCRAEMPALDRLQAALPDIAVVPVAVGRNAEPAMTRFFDEVGVTHLTVLRDPGSDLARPMAVLGLPVTVIVNPDGAEVARLIGGAEWDGPAARAVLAALMAP